MNEGLAQLIAIEEGMERLYRLFCSKFPEHREFFSQLADEEQRHAGVLKELLTLPAQEIAQAINLISRRVDEFEQVNQLLAREHRGFEELPKTVIEGLELAFKLEESAGELHYQFVVTTEVKNRALEKIRGLTGADRDHAQRVRSYLKELNPRRGR